jgi:hypothetical protein
MFGEVVLLARSLVQQGVLETMNERMRGCHGGETFATRSSISRGPDRATPRNGERRLPACYAHELRNTSHKRAAVDRSYSFLA